MATTEAIAIMTMTIMKMTTHTKKKKKKNKHKHKHKEEHKKVVLFICDPQNDYSDEGSIPIPNSNMDSNRIYDMIKDHMDDILEIYVVFGFKASNAYIESN